jgi:hypothetical protein
MSLKGIGQVYIEWKSKRRYLQIMIDGAINYPRYPHTTLA